MSVSDLPLFSMLKTRIRWLEQRQKLLSDNVANANTQRYRPRHLKQLDFNAELDATTAQTSVRLAAATQPGHFTGASTGNTSFHQASHGSFEMKPSGNTIMREEEMMKVAQIQMDHQTATSLYARGLGMIKTLLGTG